MLFLKKYSRAFADTCVGGIDVLSAEVVSGLAGLLGTVGDAQYTCCILLSGIVPIVTSHGVSNLKLGPAGWVTNC